MLDLHYTSITAAILAVGLVLLSIPISLRRRSAKVSLGVGDDAALQKLVRAHGNFCEYAPFGLLLLALTECLGAGKHAVVFIAGALLLGRLVHAVGMLLTSTPMRAIGMLLTFASILTAAFSLAKVYLAAV
jgi:uncharacterized membrane protein YecN with MAPEG domain